LETGNGKIETGNRKFESPGEDAAPRFNREQTKSKAAGLEARRYMKQTAKPNSIGKRKRRRDADATN
jgi:hypothetical protein